MNTNTLSLRQNSVLGFINQAEYDNFVLAIGYTFTHKQRTKDREERSKWKAEWNRLCRFRHNLADFVTEQKNAGIGYDSVREAVAAYTAQTNDTL